MPDDLSLILQFVERAQRARGEQTDQSWHAVAELWDEEVEIRVADGRTGGATWRTTAKGRDKALGRLSRPEVNSARLRTTTVRSFESQEGGTVVVEQVSEITSDDGTVTQVPVCHIFEVAEGRILRQSIYRNEA